ncbi:MAG: hypothetical protein A2341_03085 [Deltaproteobacteria bacterium RIFOXYB12_FULL_58_9]|nr:MAG: hypothetical protein A2341_03085 [Deltaproteobacteria bacterium RIFOXYB12_FULL_58_9]
MENRQEPQTTSSDETARQFKAIVMHAADGVLVVDMAGTVRFANPAAEVILARSGAELIGTNFGHPVVAGESTEMTLIRKDATPAPVEIEVSEALLARAQRVAKLGHWEWNLSRQELTWSDEIYRIFEFDRGTPPTFDGIVSLIHPEDRARNQAFVDGLLACAEHAELQFRLLLPDGRIKHVLQIRRGSPRRRRCAGRCHWHHA